jgi:hypothetical protein
MCLVNGEEHATMVVRAAPAGQRTMLSGLGAGSYVVRASAPRLASVASSRIDLATNDSSVTSLSLAPGPGPLVAFHYTPGAADAASVVDASSDVYASADTGPIISSDASDAAGIDAGPPPFDGGTTTDRVFRAPVLLPSGLNAGMAEATLSPHDSVSTDVTVRFVAYQCPAPCALIDLASAEIRAASGGQPVDFAVEHFTPELAMLGSTSTSMTQTIQASIDDTTLDLTIAVFGSPALADGGLITRDY